MAVSGAIVSAAAGGLTNVAVFGGDTMAGTTVAIDCTMESESVLSCVFSLIHAGRNYYFTRLELYFCSLF